MNPRNVRNSRQSYSGGRPSRPRKASARPKLSPEAARALAYLIVGFFAVLGVWQVFAVRTITVAGNKTLSTDAVTKLVNQSFDRHLLSGNLLTLSLAHLSTDLPANSERISGVSVAPQWPSGIKVTITERQSALGWNSGGVTYALDAGGKIIGLLSEVGSNVPVVTDSTNLPVKVGDTVAPARFVTFSTTLATNLPKETGIAISSLRVTDTTSELYVVTNKGYQLKLDTTRGVEEQLADLKQVLATLSTQKKTPAEYIDLRIANKAYWK